jgi:putative DNA primase/helicase
MNTSAIIQNQQQFLGNATGFFNTLFEPSFNAEAGHIEIRTFPKGQPPQQFHCQSEVEAAQIAYKLCNSGIDVYFGINPRVGDAGKKENVHFLAAFHAEIDYGADGHKKNPIYATYDEALSAITVFRMKPTIVNHSGGGFHCYWALSNPVKVTEKGIELLESLNKALLRLLGGDTGTHDISRVLRVPGTFNFKLPDNPREVVNVWLDGPSYSFEDFEWLLAEDQVQGKKTQRAAKNQKIQAATTPEAVWSQDIDQLPISERIKTLIKTGWDQKYQSRSEADMAVIITLVNKGMELSDIKSIFASYPIGDKYREHSSPDTYLQHNYDRAKQFVKQTNTLSDEELQDPLFISGALRKNPKGDTILDVVAFQRYMTKKFKLKYLENENSFFRFNGKSYQVCGREHLNHLCQKELGRYQGLFGMQMKSNFFHFCSGSTLIIGDKAYGDQIRYLTLQNGLFDLNSYELVPHTPDIFTTNLLPYDYNPEAKCPRFLQYLDEVFMGDRETIECVQEAVGYTFYKSIPKPALFCLIGGGGNGKSVFIDTLMNLCGAENASTISLNMLSNEYYLLDLFGKMINVSSETPTKKLLNTNLLKAVTAGDTVTARKPYEGPTKFRPFAKHFVAMNEAPVIEDSSHGMWRRLYIINFPRRFRESEMDVFLTEKLKHELSGIFNWALLGFRRLRDRSFRFDESSTMKASKQDYKAKSNSALSFAAEYLEKASPDDSLRFKDVYEMYESYSEKEGYNSRMKKNAFKKTLQTAGFLIENSSKHSNELRIFGVRMS